MINLVFGKPDGQPMPIEELTRVLRLGQRDAPTSRIITVLVNKAGGPPCGADWCANGVPHTWYEHTYISFSIASSADVEAIKDEAEKRINSTKPGQYSWLAELAATELTDIPGVAGVSAYVPS